jgi:carbonic anhydrase
MSADHTTQTAHGVRDLVISCIDYRFRPVVAKWIKENLHDQADLVSVAGASKAPISQESHDYILEQIKIGQDLHGVTTIHVLDHVDCGAYGGSKMHEDQKHEESFHQHQCELAQTAIKEAFPDMTIKSYLVTFDDVHELQC